MSRIGRLYTRIVSNLLFPLQERLKGHDTVRVRRRLEQSQWWSMERIADLQAARLNDLARHAYEQVPYYRRAFDEQKIQPDDIRSPADGALPGRAGAHHHRVRRQRA